MRFFWKPVVRRQDLRNWIAAHGITLLNGIICGFYALSWCYQFPAALGSGLSTTTAMGLAAAVGIGLGLRPANSPFIENRLAAIHVRWRLPAVHLGLALWTLSFPWLVGIPLAVAGWFSVAAFASTSFAFGFAFTAAVLLLTLPTYCLLCTARLVSTGQGGLRSSQKVSQDFSLWSIGLSIGLLMDAYLTAPFLGLFWSAVASTVVGVLAYCWWSLQGSGLQGLADTAVPSNKPLRNPGLPAISNSPVWAAWSVCCVAVMGLLMGVLSRMVVQLMPATSYLLTTVWAVLILGVTIGLRWSRRPIRSESNLIDREWRVCCLAACWCLVFLTAFPLLVSLCLTLNSYVAYLWPLIMLRGLLVVPVFLPLGFAWGVIAGRPGQESSTETSPFGTLAAVSPMIFVVGCSAAGWVVIPLLGTPTAYVIATWLLAVLALLRWWPVRSLPSGWKKQTATVAVLVSVTAAPWLASRYDPVRAAKILFDSHVFAAHRAGVDRHLLPFLDEGRPVRVLEGRRGTYSVWNYRGAQLQIRANGVPKGLVSTDVRFCPEVSTEVLQAIVPMVLHERPYRVLMMGLGAGVPLNTCLAFPVQQMTCVEADTTLISLLRDEAASVSESLQDDRLQLLSAEPTLAAAGREEPYDVIIVNPDEPALAQAAPVFTRQFFQRIASQLKPQGIFCQRFHHVDFGAEPIRTMARTMQDAFREVRAVEIAPGELLFLGTNATSGLLRANLKERMEAPHVRSILSRVGWDWTVLLTLPAFDDLALAELSVESNTAANTIANGHFSFRLPREMMRWGPKLREAHEMLSPQQTTLLAWLGGEAEFPEITRRLSEVRIQTSIINDNPDQYWAYRKKVRDQVRNNPRTLIEPISADSGLGQMHAEDKRRMRYFAALGKALGQKPLAPDALSRVVSFSTPYDPLLSYFLHQEVSELYDRVEPEDPGDELVHRLYTVYFSTSRDRSVRNVAAAIKLLREHPEAVEDPIRRWDMLNALLQMLKHRWDVRSTLPPDSSEIVLNDIDQSVSAIEQSFLAMEQLAAQSGIPESDWRSRQKVLEKSLLRPLRTYRTQLFPHHDRRRFSEQTRAAN